MKILIELETTEAETFSALEKLEYFGDRIREAAALFQGKIIDETLSDFPWPPEKAWKDQEHDYDHDHGHDHEHDHDEDEDEDDDSRVYSDIDEDEDDAVFPHSGPVATGSPADDADSDTGYWSSSVDSQYEWEKESDATPAQPVIQKNNLPKLSEEVRAGAWKSFEDLITLWCQNFDLPGDQPDRLEALRQAGTGRYTLPVLIMAYELGSLQRLIEKALILLAIGPSESAERLDYADKIAANMVQISHLTFPDLAGTYDYSTKWRR